MKATGGKFSDWSAGKAKGAYQKSAKEGNLASAKGKLMMGAGSQITRLPGIGSAVGGKTMMAGAKLEGAKAAAEKSKWESLSEDNLKTIHARSSGKVKVDAAKEMDRRRKEAVDKQSERVARGQAPDAALSKKIDSLQVARLTGGGDRSGYYYDPTTGAQTMEVTGTGAQEIATGFLIAFNKTGGAGGAPPAPPTGASNTPQPGVPSAQTVAVPSGATPVYVGTPGGRTNIPDLSGLNKTP